MMLLKFCETHCDFKHKTFKYKIQTLKEFHNDKYFLAWKYCNNSS